MNQKVTSFRLQLGKTTAGLVKQHLQEIGGSVVK